LDARRARRFARGRKESPEVASNKCDFRPFFRLEIAYARDSLVGDR
jgi:hypothetical protein